MGCIWVLGQRSTAAHGRAGADEEEEEGGSFSGERRIGAGVRAYELSVPLTDKPTRSSPGFKPCHLKTKTPTHSISALP